MSELNLELPEPLKVDKNIARQLDDLENKGKTAFPFEGEMNIETLFELFLIKKYKSKCVIFGKNVPLGTKPTGLIINLKAKYTKNEQEKMKEDFEHISKKLVECIKNGENTIMIPLTCIRGRGTHANVLIYRKKLRQLEHFEPHGGSYMLDVSYLDMTSNIMTKLTNILNSELTKNNLPQVNYVEASQVCPYISGLQEFESKSKLGKSKYEPGGYCSAWSMFFSELCFKNPEMSSSEIMNNIYNYLTTKPSAEDYLRKVIRGYAGYIFETVNKYLEIFFKPKLTVIDVMYFRKSNPKLTQLGRLARLEDALKVLIMIESMALLDPNFNLKKELKETKQKYKEKTKGLTEKQIRMKKILYPELADLYYKKRILQNYEEYSNYGKITEPIFDSPLEIRREEIINPTVLTMGRPNQTRKERKKVQMDKIKQERERIYNLVYKPLLNKQTNEKSLKNRKSSSSNSKTKRNK